MALALFSDRQQIAVFETIRVIAMALAIEDYALIGDCRTAALVGRNGSIDWLCVPRFDSPACFAALLGTSDHGHWRIGPKRPTSVSRRGYRGDTLILDTDFETETGIVRITDFMPMAEGNSSVVRIVSGLEGQVELRMDLVIRFDYGRLVPWVTRGDGDLLAVGGSHQLVLRCPVEHHGENFTTVAEFAVKAGEEIPFILSHGPSHLPAPAAFDARAALIDTEQYWTDWASKCRYDGPYRPAVIRSLIVLKALTHHPTGGIVAAPTTSLPEEPGGVRNWDYRYSWLRDASMVLLTLLQAGYREEAEAWRSWLTRAVAGLPQQLQPVYSVSGDRWLDEWEMPWLPGYENSRPVRVGNAAFAQLQLDSFGEVLDALHHGRRSRLAPSAASWSLQKALLVYLETLRDVPDRGIWEIRAPAQHFTHSKVMIWVAFDRAVSAVEHYGLDGPLERWRAIRDSLHAEICSRGYNSDVGAFVQSYESRQLDASALMLPLVGFLPADDARIVGTVDAIGKHLMHNGFIRRYDAREPQDGLPPGEGVFLACTFWFADNLILQGKWAEATDIFERLLEIRNDVGLLPEEYDPENGRFLGNFPQALSHLALVGTAYNLREFHGPARQRSKLRRED